MRRSTSNKLRTAIATACAGLAMVLVNPAVASHIGESLSLDQQVVTATDQLLAGLAQWEKMPASLKASGVAQLVQQAQHRQEHMILLLQQNPKLAAARLLPKSLRAKLPAEAAAFVEQEVRVQGVARAHVSDDFARGRSSAVFKLHDSADPGPLNIYLADPDGSERDLHHMTGKKASFTAMRIGNNLLILDKKQIQLEAAGGATGSTTGSTVVAAGTVVQGSQKTLSILVNFSDSAVTCTAPDVASRLFGSAGATVNNNYKESSRGLVSFTGQVVGPYTINYSSTGSCDYLGWGTAANAAAKAAGFDPALYQRVNYVTPPNWSCGWNGLAYMPGQQSWVQACSATGVFSHELGHNLSLNHASTIDYEYGDSSDPMGGAQVVDHNGANRTMAGWMPSGSVQDVTTANSYALATVSTNAAATSPQVLRIAKPDTSEFYYISTRAAMNLDAGLNPAYLDNISVHRSTGILPTRTYLLQNLGAGQSFNDATNGIMITNQGAGGGTATVAVAFNGGSCLRAAPTVGVAPASQTGGPGSTLTYTVSVTNHNSVACGTTTFNLAQVLPIGFSGAFSAPSLAIGAGATANSAWSLSSSAQVANGTYTLTANVVDATSGAAVAVHASDIVYLDTSAPVVSITSPAANATVSGRVNIAATATDNASVQAVEFYVDGALLGRDTKAPYAAVWDARKGVHGVHTIKVRAIDAAGNATEQSLNVTLK